MSMQQRCLPLPPRRRKRPAPTQTENAIGDSDGTNRTENANPSTPIASTTPMEISSLANMDAMAYLASVKEQASSLPDIFVSELESNSIASQNQTRTREEEAIDGSAAARNYLFSSHLDIMPPPTIHHTLQLSSPDKQNWVNSTLDNFSALRTYLHNCRQVLKKCHRVSVPKSKDYAAWISFCLGDEIKTIDFDDQEMNGDDNGGEEALTMTRTYGEIQQTFHIPNMGNEPTTKLMSQFDQIIIRRLLSHFVTFLRFYSIDEGNRNADGNEKNQNYHHKWKWIYSLLARLEKPLHRDEASTLMELLRILCRIRAGVKLEGFGSDDNGNAHEHELENPRRHVKMLNVLIVLIGVYFEQCTDIKKLMVPPLKN